MCEVNRWDYEVDSATFSGIEMLDCLDDLVNLYCM